MNDRTTNYLIYYNLGWKQAKLTQNLAFFGGKLIKIGDFQKIVSSNTVRRRQNKCRRIFRGCDLQTILPFLKKYFPAK